MDGFTETNPSITLSSATLRALRDEISAHLGDKPAAISVGTIRTGEGLTEEMKNGRFDAGSASRFRAMQIALKGATGGSWWNGTQEGYDFWEKIHWRLGDLARHVEMVFQEREKRVDFVVIADTVVGSCTGTSVYVSVRSNAQHFSPEKARELAAALTKHADAAEKA
jgi:hypothetical protein